MAYGIPPWEFEDQITSDWVTKLLAYKNEYTLAPALSRAVAIASREVAASRGVKATIDDFVDKRVWVLQEEKNEQELQSFEAMFPG